MILNSDLIFFIASITFILIYYLCLKLKRSSAESNVHTFNAQIRKQWVYKIMGNDSLSIVAIQTLRNSVIAANFMASTSILLIMGALNLGDKTKQLALFLPFNDIVSVSSTEIWQLKLGLLLLNFSFAFYCFSMATRFFNHVGYMISLPIDKDFSFNHFLGSYYFSIYPQLSFGFGSDNFVQLRKRSLLQEKKKAPLTDSVIQNTFFGLLAFDASVDFTYTIKNFDFYVSPHFAVPFNVLDDKNKRNPSAGTPIFYTSLGVTYRFKMWQPKEHRIHH